MQSTSLPPPISQTQLFSHQAAAAQFVAAWQGARLAHGWLISGPTGVGKATFAYHAARYALADDKPVSFIQPPNHKLYTQMAGGACPGLHSISLDDSLHAEDEEDVEESSKTSSKKKTLGVETIRGMQPFLRQTVADGGWRVVVIEDADALTIPAQNALLKMLEEPPAKTLIILCAIQAGRLLPTIRSRTRQLQLQPIIQRQEFLTAARALGMALPTGPALDFLVRQSAGCLGELARLIELDAASLAPEVAGLLTAKPAVIASTAKNLGAKKNEAQLTLAIDLLLQDYAAAARTNSAAAMAWPAVQAEAARMHSAALNKASALIELVTTMQTALAGRLRLQAAGMV